MTVSGERSARRQWVSILALLATLVGLQLTFGVGSSPAFAHAELLETTPEDGAVLDIAPEAVELRFNEPVRVVDDAMRLFPGDGAPATLTARTSNTAVIINLPDELGNGAYTLAYRVVSADGHPIGGALTFQIGDGDYATPVSSVASADPVVAEMIVSVLTVAQYLGLLALAGLVFFNRLVIRSPNGAESRIRRFSRISYGTAVVASLLLIPVSGARVTGNEFITYLPETGELVLLSAQTWLPGVSWQLPVTAGLVLGFGLAALISQTRANARLWQHLGVLCTVGALASPVLIGHTQTVQPTWAMLLADLGHLMTGAFWVGGTIGLLCVLAAARPASSQGLPGIPSNSLLEVVARFSQYALISVIVLAVSGTVMAFLIVGSWGALFGSWYGCLLLIKLGIVAVVVVLAAWNRLRVLPRITSQPSERQQWTSLRRTLTGEAVLLIAVIAVTGFLTNTSPNSAPEREQGGSIAGSAAKEVRLDASSQGLTVDGSVIPAAGGENALTFRLEYDGEPVTSDEVSLEARLPEQQLGPFSASPQFNPETGEYKAQLMLPVSGTWQIQISARIDAYSQPIAVIPVTIN
ncbi:copper resistance protein CopC [Leucobacter sp. cx-42]|uniref:copper resistance protein CopC n=1 Tax=unclassified Leucobacter TaxID=2621730 RepID=UPI00165D3707|nr:MULTISPECIES: copper resistance protein CopC [unclassified Leucobacter]MBC9954477.1 copper resistance protein CopC [Leucobacter sp. cx-42]